MSWINWLIKAALTVVAVWLITETVSYVITKQSLRNLLLQKKSKRKFEDLVSVIIQKSDGHEVTFDMFDSQQNNLGSGKVTSKAGVSKDIYAGELIVL